MPLQTLIRAAVPFVAGGAVAIFVSELTRTTVVTGESLSATWNDDVSSTEHLWLGEPTFDWGD
ncbi:MAG TPA: hypothetical protein VHS03_03140 [Gaiellaceae bacterium]|jgi:hypothetical protein|nr:hypothetical protein [Gaiellaceae bacterium]